MTQALAHRGLKGLIQLRWLLSLMSAVLLLCLSGASAQAHGSHTPFQGAAVATVSQPTATGLVAVVFQTRDEALFKDHDDCPGGSGHVDHMACAGVSCHAVAGGAGLVLDCPRSQGDYEGLAMTAGDGRIIAPLFHPPKI